MRNPQPCPSPQVVFSKLGRPEVRAIADIMLRETVGRVKGKG